MLARRLALVCLLLTGCATEPFITLDLPEAVSRVSFSEEGEIRDALHAAGVSKDLRVWPTGEGTPREGLVYEACDDEYAYGDRPGRPSEPCASSTRYMVSSVGGVWLAQRIDPGPPPFFDCFAYIQIVDGPWDDAEVGLKIPLHVHP